MKKTELLNLIQRTVDGESEAFAVLYEAYYNKIYYLCLKLLQNRDDANDIAQETFASAFENLRRLSNAFAFESWLKTIAVNKCKNYLKKCKPVLFSQYDNEDHTEFLIEDENAENAEEAFDDFETRRIINHIIDQLPDEQRICIILYYYDEKTVSEIAEFLECSNGTVKSRLNYARKKIRNEIERIEKENNIQLHSASAIPLLRMIISKQMPKTTVHPSFDSILKHAAEMTNSLPDSSVQETAKPDDTGSSIQEAKNPADTTNSAKTSVTKKLFKTTASKITAGALSAVMLVSGGVFAGSQLNSGKNNPEISTTVSTTENTTRLSLGTIKNVQADQYNVYENLYNDDGELVEDVGGGFGLLISFDPVENAQGYRLKYIFGNDEVEYQDLNAGQTKICYTGNGGPSSIEACAFAKDDNGEIIYGDWVEILSYEEGFITYHHTDLPIEKWNEMSSEYFELNISAQKNDGQY